MLKIRSAANLPVTDDPIDVNVGSFEPEPVTVTVIGIVIMVIDARIGKRLGNVLRIVAMQMSMIQSTSTKIREIRQR